MSDENEKQGKLLTDQEVATYLSIAPKSVTRSRVTGLLLGRKAPPFLKIGTLVRYDERKLQAWIEAQSVEAHTTAESFVKSLGRH